MVQKKYYLETKESIVLRVFFSASHCLYREKLTSIFFTSLYTFLLIKFGHQNISLHVLLCPKVSENGIKSLSLCNLNTLREEISAEVNFAIQGEIFFRILQEFNFTVEQYTTSFFCAEKYSFLIAFSVILKYNHLHNI